MEKSSIISSQGKVIASNGIYPAKNDFPIWYGSICIAEDPKVWPAEEETWTFAGEYVQLERCSNWRVVLARVNTQIKPVKQTKWTEIETGHVGVPKLEFGPLANVYICPHRQEVVIFLRGLKRTHYRRITFGAPDAHNITKSLPLSEQGLEALRAI